MERRDLRPGDLVQLSCATTRNKIFSGCIMVVTEPKEWGAQGFIQLAGKNGDAGGQAYYRARWEEMENCGGRAVWVPVNQFELG